MISSPLARPGIFQVKTEVTPLSVIVENNGSAPLRLCADFVSVDGDVFGDVSIPSTVNNE